MASSRLPEREVREEPRRAAAAAASLDVCPHKHSLLVLVGRTAEPGHAELVGGDIQRGIRSWDVNLKSCNLDLYLQEFLSRHTASFKGAGQKCLRHSSRVFDTQVLISPSQDQVHSEVVALLSRESAHKLLILTGQSVEESGDLLFNKGVFSANHLKQILTEQFIDQDSSLSVKPSLTLSCPNIGQWRKTLLGNQPLQGPFTLHINPPEVLPPMAALGEFTSLISGTLSPTSPFELLPPPTTVGFLKLSRPCCYVFPAGRGDCAFFAVNGFTMLVDGGSEPQACFWKLVRHLDRVDAVLLTHIGTENLTGINCFLERKVAELELGSDVKVDSSKRLISPEMGIVFFNAPSKLQTEKQLCVDNVLRSTHQAAVTLKLLKKLEIRPQPMFRPQTATIEPITLFQKMGVGQLDLYILNPSKNSQEYQTLMQNWPDAASTESKPPTLPLTALTSVCALLVWHPACPQEKVVRVLFPGITPQTKLLQGLEKLKTLAFLQKPTVTTGDMERLGEDKKTKRTESLDSRGSQGKEAAPKHGKEGKEMQVKERGKSLNGADSRDVDKTQVKETGKQKAIMSEKNTLKKGAGKDGRKERKSGSREEKGAAVNDLGKKELLSSKPKNDGKTKLKNEAKNDSKTGVKKTKKTSGKEANVDKKTQLKAESSKNNSTKRDSRSALEIPELEDTDQTMEKEPENDPCGTKVSTPEDMTADFLRFQEETERERARLQTADKETLQNSQPRTEKSLSKESKDSVDTLGAETTAAGGGSGDNAEVEGVGTSDTSLEAGHEDHQHGNDAKPAKVVGFPAPLNAAQRHERTVQLDLTPTEYTLLDGALRSSPPSRSSPENPAPVSPEEKTVEPASPNSRPNSAGHTPYCLSPDDVWCNRAATLSRLQAQMDLDSTDPAPKSAQSKQSGQDSHANPREKHLSFLSLGPLKDGTPDPSPSVATTTTTHSMPAELSSPQSTEVDESLSMSFEQGPITVSQREGDDSTQLSHSKGSHFVGMGLPVKKPPRSLGQNSEMARPPAPSTLMFEASAHDVDLCLVSPCEFKHFKPSDSGFDASRVAFGPQQHGNNVNHKESSPSESNAPVCTEDCPSTTAEGVLDSDEDESCSEPTNSPLNIHANQALPPDPPPAPLRDSPPLASHPDVSMPVPQSDSDNHGKRIKTAGMRGKKTSGVLEASPGSGKSWTGNQGGVTKGKSTASPRTTSLSARSSPAKSSPSPASKSASVDEVSVYVDLAYIPSAASSPTVNVDFFRCVRSSCYIISGDGPQREELMRHTLDALLDGKASWGDTMQVTVIPTFASVSMQDWYQNTLDRQKEQGIIVLGSNSTVAMQDETFPACKIEF